jgi:hypothetical protein
MLMPPTGRPASIAARIAAMALVALIAAIATSAEAAARVGPVKAGAAR